MLITQPGIFQLITYFIVLLVLIGPLGWYMARIYAGMPCKNNANPLSRLEHWIYRCCRIQPENEMDWKKYLTAMLCFSFTGMLLLYAMQRLQFYLPLNPQHFPAVAPDLALNTATSFITNTNWQAYAGESSLSHATQMLGLTVQNFFSAATGMSLFVALCRGISREESQTLGNFWTDTVRGILYILLPLATVLALALVSQGVIQNFHPDQKVQLVEPQKTATGLQKEQILPMGPVASQIAIKQLGTNGGGFFNANSAHPFENPTPVSNLLEMLAILLIPAASCLTFGRLIGDPRQGWMLLATMFLLLTPLAITNIAIEQRGNPLFSALETDIAPHTHLSSGGNMEGKETRFGIVSSALWATATTASSNGSVNAMHDSFMPLGGLILLWLMHSGEIIFGGTGSGVYGMLMTVILTVFLAGLMVGRTPEYAGKKIGLHEIKMASVTTLVMPLLILILTAITVASPLAHTTTGNPGAHGFSEILYAFTSMFNNNGSAFAGLKSNTPFYNLAGSLIMLCGRFWIAIPALAIAGSLARKKTVPAGSGTLQTHTPLFILMLISVILVLGALTFLPALTLGPVIEHLMLWSQYGNQNPVVG